MTTWLIDTALFKSPPHGSTKPTLRHWIRANDDPIFLSSASIIVLMAAIGKITAIRNGRTDGLRSWLDYLVANFPDRIHPVDINIAVRAGALWRETYLANPKVRFHDAVLSATAEFHGHTLLTMRQNDFGPLQQAGDVKVQFL